MKKYQLDKEEKRVIKDFNNHKYGKKSDNKTKLLKYQKIAQNQIS